MRGGDNRGRLAPKGLSEGLVAQLFGIFDGLPITGKQDGLVAAPEVERLALVSYEPLKARATRAWPYFDSAYHERLSKIKQVHKKAPALDRLGQKTMERK